MKLVYLATKQCFIQTPWLWGGGGNFKFRGSGAPFTHEHNIVVCWVLGEFEIFFFGGGGNSPPPPKPSGWNTGHQATLRWSKTLFYAVSLSYNRGEMLARCQSNITRSVKENKSNSPRSRPHLTRRDLVPTGGTTIHRKLTKNPINQKWAAEPVLMLDLLGSNYQFNSIQGWAGQLCQIRCRAVI